METGHVVLKPEGRSLFPFAAIAFVAGLILLAVFGVYRSYNYVKATDENRIAAQEKEKADALESTKESHRRMIEQMKKNMEDPNLRQPPKDELERSINRVKESVEKENARRRQAEVDIEEAKSRRAPPPH